MVATLVDTTLKREAQVSSEAGHPPRERATYGRHERASPTAPRENGSLLNNFDVIVGQPLNAVPNPQTYPWSAIALLSMAFENGATGQGTGWFFSPSRVATAAHNLYHPRAGRATNMSIQPGWNGMRSLDTLAVSAPLIAPNWTNGFNEQDDWAIIGTDHPAVSSVGWFGYQAYDDGYPPSLILNVSGYPADTYGAAGDLAPASLPGGGFQYMDSGYLASETPTEIVYTVSTAEGMSGSPVFITPGSSRYAVGIHTQGRVTTNAGRRIDNQLLGVLNSYWSH